MFHIFSVGSQDLARWTDTAMVSSTLPLLLIPPGSVWPHPLEFALLGFILYMKYFLSHCFNLFFPHFGNI